MPAYSISVYKDHAVSVPVGPSGTTLTVVAGNTLYYSDSNQVSAASNQGSLTAGNSTTITSDTPLWLISASETDVSVNVASSTADVTPDPLAKALGLQTWNLHPSNTGTSQAPVAGTIYAVGIPLQKGQLVTNVVFLVNVAGAGTAPTSIFCGLANASQMLAQSSNLNASGQWLSTGLRTAALSNAYTVPTSGLYYAVFLQVGAWGTTQMTLGRASGPPTAPNGTQPQATLGTAQTALPANAAAVTLSASGAFNFFAGAN